MKQQIAKNNGKYYRVDNRQMRYFPMKKVEAELALATQAATEVPYLPFSRGDLWFTHMNKAK